MSVVHAPAPVPPFTRGAGTAVALVATLGLAAAGWVVLARQMPGMDRGAATELGPLGPFVVLWTAMTAAMMLPAAAPALVRRVRADGGVRGVPLFVGSYLAVWTAVGLAVHAVYRPHGPLAAGAALIAAGCYELTAAKQHFRRHCRDGVRSGLRHGLHCVGSCLGLVLALVAVGVMSLPWTVAVTALTLAQRLLPPRAAVDVALGLGLLALGLLLVAAPGVVPGLVPVPAPHHQAGASHPF